MKATYDPETHRYTIEDISPHDAHHLIWGGKPSDIVLVEQRLREVLVYAEDNQMSDEEYVTLFQGTRE